MTFKANHAELKLYHTIYPPTYIETHGEYLTAGSDQSELVPPFAIDRSQAFKGATQPSDTRAKGFYP